MGEITELVLDGVIDYRTGEYIGAAVGYPRTLVRDKRYIPKSKVNEYGYESNNWRNMKESSREVIKYLYSKGFISVDHRQYMMDKYIRDNKLFIDGTDRLPKNNRKYTLIYNRFDHFKKFIENYNYGEFK